MKKIDAMTGFALRLRFANGTGANYTRRASVLAAMAMALMPQMMRAQVPAGFKLLDDFTKGNNQPVQVVTGTKSNTYTDPHPDGNPIGGFRVIEVVVENGNNPYSQPSQAQVVTDPGNGVAPAFVGWFGYGATGGRIYLQYGSVALPLNLYLTNYDRFRFVFSGLTNGLGSFDMPAFQGYIPGSTTNNEGSACGLDVTPNASTFMSPAQFTVDFPISAFTGGAAVDWSNIEILEMFVQGSPGMAITGFYAIEKGTDLSEGPVGSLQGPASFTCVPPTATLAEKP